MTHLFNAYEAMDHNGSDFADDIGRMIEPTIAKWLAAGYSGRDMEAIAISVVTQTFAEKILIAAMHRRRVEREDRKATGCACGERCPDCDCEGE